MNNNRQILDQILNDLSETPAILLYHDDIVVLSHNRQLVQKISDGLDAILEANGFTVNRTTGMAKNETNTISQNPAPTTD